MGTLTGFIHYDGRWDSTNEYVYFKMVGVLWPLDCTLNMLKQIIAEELKVLRPEEKKKKKKKKVILFSIKWIKVSHQ